MQAINSGHLHAYGRRLMSSNKFLLELRASWECRTLPATEMIEPWRWVITLLNCLVYDQSGAWFTWHILGKMCRKSDIRHTFVRITGVRRIIFGCCPSFSTDGSLPNYQSWFQGRDVNVIHRIPLTGLAFQWLSGVMLVTSRTYPSAPRQWEANTVQWSGIIYISTKVVVSSTGNHSN